MRVSPLAGRRAASCTNRLMDLFCLSLWVDDCVKNARERARLAQEVGLGGIDPEGGVGRIEEDLAVVGQARRHAEAHGEVVHRAVGAEGFGGHTGEGALGAGDEFRGDGDDRVQRVGLVAGALLPRGAVGAEVGMFVRHEREKGHKAKVFVNQERRNWCRLTGR